MNYTVQRVLAAVMLVFALPLMLLIALGCVLFSRFPVFFRSERIGQDKKRFILYKFRTMKNSGSDFMTPEQQREWAQFGKLKDDDRVTAFGRFLRHFSLDELPQLWNVVRGDMALVGPRPIVDAEEIIYGKYSDLIHSVKPGITGLWQVSGRNLVNYHRRIAINCYYARHRSLKLDLWIMYRTVWAVISGRGAF
jgi:lipopolysaccharide/colanic/teichoic acid biosynthesis glycosyltransferase